MEEREFMTKTAQFKPQCANVFFHILTRCNLKCQHCSIDPKVHGGNILNIGTIEKWLKLLTHPCLPSNLVFLGGEPTLHPDLPKAISIAKKLGFRSISVNTNGFLFNNILRRVSPAQVDNFAFSLDGATEKINDKIRGTGSFKICLNGIQKTMKTGFNTSVCFTVSQLNMNNLKLMPKLLKDLDTQRLFVQFVGVRGRAKLIPNIQLNKQQWERTLSDLKKEAKKHQIWLTFPKIFLNPEEKFLCAGKCSQNLNIFPNGRVFKCPLGIDLAINFARIQSNKLIRSKKKVTENHLFDLKIPWGCPLSKIVHPDNFGLTKTGKPDFKIGCCMLKENLK